VRPAYKIRLFRDWESEVSMAPEGEGIGANVGSKCEGNSLARGRRNRTSEVD